VWPEARRLEYSVSRDVVLKNFIPKNAEIGKSGMSKLKAFIVVGHENWGKSRTLLSFTDERRTRSIIINNLKFIIKRMSNDDFSKGLLDFVLSQTNNIIIALCPNFNNKERYTNEILKELNARYDCYFWIMKYNWDNTAEISSQEIDILKNYGQIEIVIEHMDSLKRAERFRIFLSNNL
jgi:hypothetical protein